MSDQTEKDLIANADTSVESPLGAATNLAEAGSDVALLEDPFRLNTLEIAEAQSIADELDLEEGELEIPDNEAQLENLARIIAEEEQKETEDLEARVAADAQEAAQDLATQIAEDEALARELAAEGEESNGPDAELEAALPQNININDDGSLDLSEVQSCIEALLFLSEKPMPQKRLHELLGPNFDESVFTQALQGLMERYQASHHGFELVEIAGGFQFRTKPGRAPLAKKLARVQTQRLSGGAMETLAIIAYKQPLMKEEVDKIRGVDSSYFIRGLMDRKLIEISGRSELPGRPMLYSTTREFLEIFGLKDLQAMPPLHELEAMVPASQSANPEEDPRIREMRRLVGEMKSDTSTTLQYDPREDEKILREIKDRVGAIATSTPYIEEQKALAKQATLIPEAETATQPVLPIQEPQAEPPVAPAPEV